MQEKEKEMAKKPNKVRGFKKIASKISKRQGVSIEGANAILAWRTRNASPSAKKKNPRLKRVLGSQKKK